MDTKMASTLGELKSSNYQTIPIKEEMRRNLVRRLAEGLPPVDGLVGFEDSVLPQLSNAILAGHDIIFLGERGQAKTRTIRSLVSLLDEWIPIVSGSEVNDDPYAPISRAAKDLVAQMGDQTPISWIGPDRRYSEKLATPDSSIADLIGEVDPIKVAQGRYLSDELTLHYGLIPRVNRGIFAVNELPDLAERIQVGLLNILEERDVQIRGYAIRLPLDVMLVASANPEDYTNRGRIITPLKDRFGSQIRTHYPRDIESEIQIMLAESSDFDLPGIKVEVPRFMQEIVARISHEARRHPAVNQRSGVSVRLTVANYEALLANAIRRTLTNSPDAACVVPRVCDLSALASSTSGKIEIEAMDEGSDSRVIDQITKAAILETFREHCRTDRLAPVVDLFEGERVVHCGESVSTAEYASIISELGEGSAVVAELAQSTDREVMASALELVLEGLHLTKRLNKDTFGQETTYRSRG